MALCVVLKYCKNWWLKLSGSIVSDQKYLNLRYYKLIFVKLHSTKELGHIINCLTGHFQRNVCIVHELLQILLQNNWNVCQHFIFHISVIWPLASNYTPLKGIIFLIMSHVWFKHSPGVLFFYWSYWYVHWFSFYGGKFSNEKCSIMQIVWYTLQHGLWCQIMFLNQRSMLQFVQLDLVFWILIWSCERHLT